VTATDSERFTGPPPPGDQLTSAGSAEASATRAVLSIRTLPAGTYAIAPPDRPWAAIVRFGESTPAEEVGR
jgi:hypothetical protein